MKRMLLTMSIAFPVACVVGAACGADDSTPIKTTQAGGSSGDVTSGTSGNNSAGNPTTGGSGSTGMGGAGVGGASGGGTGGNAGTLGSGGMSGAGGAGGAAGGAPMLCTAGDCTAAVGDLDGWVTSSPCIDSGLGHDCNQPGCVANALTFTHDFKLTGPASDTSKFYNVTLNVRGVVECKQYGLPYTGKGDKTMTNNFIDRSATPTAQPKTGVDMFLIPTPGPNAGTPQTTLYNTHELHVEPKMPAGQASDWYLNSCPDGFGEQHRTWVLNYSQTIKVPGGSTLHYKTYDSNCREIQNCGAGDAPDSNCTGTQWTVDLTGTVPPLAPKVMQPLHTGTGQGGWGQFTAIDVTKVELAP